MAQKLELKISGQKVKIFFQVLFENQIKLFFGSGLPLDKHF
jgi:hypothetical protein